MFDEQTEQAVKQLQQDLTLEANGILSGDTTFGLMNKLREKIQKEDPQLVKAQEVLKEDIAK